MDIHVLQLRDKEQSIVSLKRGNPVSFSKGKLNEWVHPVLNQIFSHTIVIGYDTYKYNSSKVRDADFDRILIRYLNINNAVIEKSNDGLVDDPDPDPITMTGVIALNDSVNNTSIPNPADD